MLVEIQRKYGLIKAVLDKSEDPTHTEVVQLCNQAVVGLFIPTIDTGNISFEVAREKDATPVALKDGAGDVVVITATTGGFAVSCDDLTPLAAYRWVRIVTAASQSVDREFYFMVKT